MADAQRESFALPGASLSARSLKLTHDIMWLNEILAELTNGHGVRGLARKVRQAIANPPDGGCP